MGKTPALGDFNGVTRAGVGDAVWSWASALAADVWVARGPGLSWARRLLAARHGPRALGLFSAVCVEWRLIELPALLLLVCEVGLGPERDGAWRGFERGARAGRSRHSRIFRATSRSSMAASRRMRAPQPGQRSASTSKTRWSSAAQASRRGGVAGVPVLAGARKALSATLAGGWSQPAPPFVSARCSAFRSPSSPRSHASPPVGNLSTEFGFGGWHWDTPIAVSVLTAVHSAVHVDHGSVDVARAGR